MKRKFAQFARGLCWVIFLPLLFTSLANAQTAQSYKAKLPTTMTWYKFDYLGLPKDLQDKKLLYIEYQPLVNVLGLMLKTTAKKMNQSVRKALKDYPYSYTIYTQDEYLNYLEKESNIQAFDYQLKWTFDSNRGYNLLIEDLKTGQKYCAYHKFHKLLTKPIKSFMRVVDKTLGIVEYWPYPKDLEHKCNQLSTPNTLRKSHITCPVGDYLGFPPDLEKNTLVYVDTKYKSQSWKSVNLRLKRLLKNKYPFNSVVMERGSENKLIRPKYQLRFSRAYDPMTVSIYMPNSSNVSVTIRPFLLIIEDLDTGETYMPISVAVEDINMNRIFMANFNKVYNP